MPSGYFKGVFCLEFQLSHEHLSNALFHVARGRHRRTARVGLAGAPRVADTGRFPSVAISGHGCRTAWRLYWRFYRGL